jgi:hypothetical protein
MKPPKEKQALSEITERLAELFGSAPTALQVEHVGATRGYDFAVALPGYRFMAEYKSNASAGAVAAAVQGLQRCAETEKHGRLPLVVVPFMGEVGRQLCERSGVSWLDLCGNAKIIAPGLRMWIEGRPNKYSERGRPPNVFASKSSRITRQLLLYAERFQTQADLARQTGMDDGYVSKIVRRLKRENYVEANEEGAVRPRDPNLLLDAWYDAYDFNRHRIVKGHVPARSGDDLLQRVVTKILRERPEGAVTGLSAAWLYTRFAAFRLVTVYVLSFPTASLLETLPFSDEPKGANLWIVLPDDEGVFHGSQPQQGIRCVSAVQTYLDLKGQPERAKDAALQLRSKLLTWEQHGT